MRSWSVAQGCWSLAIKTRQCRSLGYSSQRFCLLFVRAAPYTAVFDLCLHFSSGVKSLEEVCLQVTDLLPGLKKLRNLLPEHGCLLLSPGNFWQNDRERFNADPDIIKTIHQHEPKALQTSATLKGKRLKCQRSYVRCLQLALLFCPRCLHYLDGCWYQIGWHFVSQHPEWSHQVFHRLLYTHVWSPFYTCGKRITPLNDPPFYRCKNNREVVWVFIPVTLHVHNAFSLVLLSVTFSACLLVTDKPAFILLPLCFHW